MVDACNPHITGYTLPTVTPTPQDAQTFTITETGSWTINFFTTVPSYCTEEISYSYNPLNDSPSTSGNSGNAFTFDSISDFTFDYTGDLDLSGGSSSTSTNYVITITGEVGGVTASADIPVTINNPCVDETFLQLVPPTLPDFDYTLYKTSPHDRFVHPEFTLVVSSPEVENTCGAVSYTVDTSFNGGVLSPYITYTAVDREVQIYAEDRSLVPGPYQYQITATVANEPSVTETATGDIYISDPCDSPFAFSVAAPQNVVSDYSTPAVFTFPAITVDPSACSSETTFTCQYVNGPALSVDLCANVNLVNGAYTTTTNFDATTGGFTMTTNDIDQFPPGNYLFTVTVTIGNQSVDVSFFITLTNPCGTATLSEGTNPFANGPFTFVLEDATPTTIAYNRNLLVSSSSAVNCGDLYIDI